MPRRIWARLAATAALLSAAACATGPSGQVYEGESLYGHYLAAEHAAAQRDTARANFHYAAALERAPEEGLLLDRAFLIAVYDGRIDRAVDLAERLIARADGPRDARLSRLVLAVDDLEAGRSESALDRARGLGQSGIVGLAADLVRAWSLAATGRAEEGAERLGRMAQGGGGPAGSFELFQAGLIHEIAGQSDRAEALYSQALDNSGAANVRIVQALASLLSREGRPAEAAEVLAAFDAASGGNVIGEWLRARLDASGEIPPVAETPQDGLAESFYGLAGAMVRERAIDLPSFYLRLALHLRPDFDVAKALLGDLMEGTGRYQDAIDVYRTIDGAPLEEAMRLQIAVNLQRLERSEEAIAVLKDVIADAPGDIEALSMLGDIYRVEEQFEKSAAVYRRAIAAAGDPEPEDWGLYYALGVALERADRWAEAEPYFLKALDLNPDQPLVLNYLGYSWIDQGLHLERALGMIKKAVAQRPDSGFIVDSLGWGYYRLGQFDKAVEHLERAVELSPGDPTLNEHLGDAYWRVGREREARFQWRHALDLDPEEDRIGKLERKLQDGLDAVEEADVHVEGGETVGTDDLPEVDPDAAAGAGS